MMKGYVDSSRGVRVSERQLKKLLPYVSPHAHCARQTSSLERTNPALYTAQYFGHKLHFDQNEKLVHYGVTYVLARDGYSGKIVGAAVMPRKNNAIIYDEVYRASALEYGLWEQIRVDHGREFYLTLFIHEQLRLAGRGNPQIAPYMQTASTYNHIIERIWVEVNHRVTYPVKRVITAMEDQGVMDMSRNETKFAVSTVLSKVCEVGLRRFVGAWNSHPIPRRGIPNVLQTTSSHTLPIHPAELPQTATAVQRYRAQGGSITDPSVFGEDPLCSNPTLMQDRTRLWTARSSSPEEIFTELMSGNTQPLQDAVLNYIDITDDLV